jgi:hypothetical protein
MEGVCLNLEVFTCMKNFENDDGGKMADTNPGWGPAGKRRAG